LATALDRVHYLQVIDTSLGAVRFSDDGKLIEVGFQPMFNASGSEAVIVTGVMVCHYPKKSKR
jgi:hypothetical protein